MKIKKIFPLLFILAGILLILLLCINTLVLDRSEPYILSEQSVSMYAPYDAVLVLGAKVHSNERLSPILRDRVDCALRLYNVRLTDRILFSGDHGQDDYDEVNACKHYALDSGVALEDIFLDHAGFSTYESMYRARDVFEVKRVLIVTQRFHLSRAVYIARSMGLDAYGVPADARRYYGAAYNALREFFARPKDFLYVKLFQPTPTYLGDTIPISGSGLPSHD